MKSYKDEIQDLIPLNIGAEVVAKQKEKVIVLHIEPQGGITTNMIEQIRMMEDSGNVQFVCLEHEIEDAIEKAGEKFIEHCLNKIATSANDRFQDLVSLDYKYTLPPKQSQGRLFNGKLKKR